MLVSPSEFYSDIAPSRVMGTEAEASIQNYYYQNGERVQVSVYEYITRLAIEAAGFVVATKFLDTGGHLKIDAGDTIEYSSPEGLGPKEAAAQDFYGIRVLQKIIQASGMPHSGLYRVAGTFLENPDEKKNSYATFGSTNGFHHNFLIPRSLLDDSVLLKEVTGSHLATRNWAMGGALRPEGFVLAQKIWGIGAPVLFGYKSGQRTNVGEKPLATVLTTDLDHDVLGTYEGWARFEDRSPDPSFDITMTELQLATTSLVLRLIEHASKLDKKGVSGRIRLLEALTLRNVVSAAHDVAGDLTLQKTIELENGNRVTARNIQEMYTEFVDELTDKVLLPEDEFRAMFDWQERNDTLGACSPDKGLYVEGAEGIHFVPRHAFLLKHFKPHELNVRNAKAAQKNLQWDRIDPEGIGMHYQRGLAAMRKRPWPGKPKRPHTRGAVRGRMIKTGEATSAAWTSVTAAGEYESLTNPFKTRRTPKQRR